MCFYNLNIGQTKGTESFILNSELFQMLGRKTVCVKELSPSGWNPPPGYRKLAGTYSEHMQFLWGGFGSFFRKFSLKMQKVHFREAKFQNFWSPLVNSHLQHMILSLPYLL